jgi:hypothetical protein
LEHRYHLAQAQAGLTALFSWQRWSLCLVLPVVLKLLTKIVQFTEKACDVEARYDDVHS